MDYIKAREFKRSSDVRGLLDSGRPISTMELHVFSVDKVEAQSGIKLSEFRMRFSAILGGVDLGDSIVVTRHGGKAGAPAESWKLTRKEISFA